MSNRAVVILTEPERCELTEPDMLMQAVLEIQQLNKAGIAASQTFCDHPAAAMKFIEAYAKAYPELQSHTADLPLPEQLYSMVANGGIMPLSAPTAPEPAKPGEASQLYPLYVLSLGAPDALMRALKHNSFASRDIQVVEIAPVERSSAEPVAVAEAIAHDRGRSWAEASADLKHDETDGFASVEWASGDPLRLDSVEVDLDQIQVDRNDDQDHYDRVLVELAPIVAAPPPAVIVATPGGATTSDAGPGAPVPTTGADGGGSVSAAPPNPTPAVSAAPLEGGAPPSLPGAGITSSLGEEGVLPEPTASAPTESVESGTPPSAGSVAGLEQGAPPDDGPQAAPVPAADPREPPPPEDPETARAPEPTDDAEPDARAEVAGRSEGMSFRAPDGDVVYRANTSFAMDDDVSYPPPVGPGLGGLLDHLYAGSGRGEIVDLEAMFGSLSESPGAPAGALDELYVRVPEIRGGGDAGASRLAPKDADAPPPDLIGSDQDSPKHLVVHDLDI
jgi:hypothetical protein